MEETLWLQVSKCAASLEEGGTWALLTTLWPHSPASLLTLQENIRDKLRPIPITASVEIQEPSSRRRVNSLPEVLPILNSNEAKTVQTDVSLPGFWFTSIYYILMQNQVSLKAIETGICFTGHLLMARCGGHVFNSSTQEAEAGGSL